MKTSFTNSAHLELGDGSARLLSKPNGSEISLTGSGVTITPVSGSAELLIGNNGNTHWFGGPSGSVKYILPLGSAIRMNAQIRLSINSRGSGTLTNRFLAS